MATSIVNPSTSDPLPTMAADDQDLGSLDVADESGRHLGKVSLPPQSSWRRICPTNRLVVILMLFCGILAVSVVILGAQGIRFKVNQRRTQGALKSFNKTLWDGISGLLQKRNGTEGRLAELEKKLTVHGNRMGTAKNRIQNQLDLLQEETKLFNCDLEELKSNGTKSGCCPKDWRSFQESCYWVSRTTASWDDAKRNCERMNSHLVIINSPAEQRFIIQQKRPGFTWIGLTDVTRVWKWVDGSDYTLNKEDWAEGQPDHWYGHNLGGGEDCVHMTRLGPWNDNHCSRQLLWICELELKM
ncbi:asialoglycoprotein receptor 1 [Pogona vitticeps]